MLPPVNMTRTESKATTTWPMSQLLAFLPKLLHNEIRSSRYYSKSHDWITMQAQTHRSRSANTDENYQKLFEEIRNLYEKAVPNEQDPEKARKYELL
jgi:peptidyl-tRNA hydrolase ICT1